MTVNTNASILNNNNNEESISFDCVSATWQAIKELSRQILEVFNKAFKATWKVLNEIFKLAGEGLKTVWNGLKIIPKYIWRGLCFLVKRVLKPITVTGVNIVGYLTDKFLFGSPFIRDALKGGVFPHDTPQVWLDRMTLNSGWSPFEATHPIPDNIFGLLGGGVGVLNILNHLLTSTYCNIVFSGHFLGENGVFGKRKLLADNRAMPVKVVFGILSFPIVFPIVALTNSADALGALLKNFCLSYIRLLFATCNLLGTHGLFGKFGQYETEDDKDTRYLATKIIFGALAAPFALLTTIPPNFFNVIGTICKNWGVSFGRLVRASYNLLGTNGLFGERGHYETEDDKDKRYLATKIIFGALAAPFALLTTIPPNFFNVVGTICKNWGVSFGRLVRATYNVLGSNGLFGERGQYETADAKDKRHLATKIIFGALAAPFAVLITLPSNVVDVIGTGFKNWGLSFGRLVRATYNVLGSNGLFGERGQYETEDDKDKRYLATKIIFGALAAPFAVLTTLPSNVVDVIGTGFKNWGLSFGRLVRATYNVLGSNGLFGERGQYETAEDKDKRHLAAKIIFGALAAPFAVLTTLPSNVVDVIGTGFKNWGLSFGRLVRATYNVLGSNGLFGERGQYETAEDKDKRHLAAKIIFGALAAPFAVLTTLPSNVVDVIGTGFKNWGLSFGRLVRATYNVLGSNGLFGERGQYETAEDKDKRHLAAKIIFGALAAPFAVLTTLPSNVVDVIGTGFKNWGLSFGRLVRATYNVLGSNGLFGERGQYETAEDKDKRHLATKIIFGALAAPFAVVTAIPPNLINILGTSCKHFCDSFSRLFRATYNILGDYGFFGPYQHYETEEDKDKRYLSTKIFFGSLAAPFAIATSLLPNGINIAGTICKHLADSCYRIFRATSNILGEYGVYGARGHYETDEDKDERMLITKIIFGALTAPFAVALSILPNAANAILTSLKQWGTSFIRILHVTINLLGDEGVLGPRGHYETEANKDNRYLASKIVFGTLAAPFAVAFSILPNTIDAIATTCRQWSNSFSRIVRATYNLLGENGLFGSRGHYETEDNKDTRHLATKIIFGTLAAPFAIATSILPNVTNAILTSFKHWGNSFTRITNATFNLLGDNGLMGSRGHYETEDNKDTRHLATKIIFGTLAAPFALAFSFLPNVVNAIATTYQHWVDSFGRIVQATYNLFGTNGLFGPRGHYETEANKDNRHLATKIIFGMLAAPFAIATSVLPNIVNAVATSFKNWGISFGRLVRATYNLLGDYGLFGPREHYETEDDKDKRHLATKIIFGALATPFAVVTCALPNLANAVGASCANWGISFGRLVRATYNLLGDYGLFGPREHYETKEDPDKRHLATKIIFGALAAPFAVITAIVPNVVNVMGASVKNWGISCGRLLLATYNLLGEHGLFGPRGYYDSAEDKDNRYLVTKVIFGALATPFVLMTSLLPNVINVVATGAKHWGESFVRLVKATYNLLGQNGLFGPQGHYETEDDKDNRHLATKIIFGALAAPFAIATTLLPNIINIIGTGFKNWGLSFSRLVKASYNLLGTKGLFGPHIPYDTAEDKDNRHLATKIIFGALATPFVFATVLIPNVINAVATSFKHWGISFKRLIQATYNILGQNGVLGPRGHYETEEDKDNRHLATKIIFGSLAAPFAMAVAIVPNIIDAIGTYAKNFGISLMRLVRATYNPLGKVGIFGPRGHYETATDKDNRHLATKIIFGALATPFAAIAATAANTVGLIGAYFKNYKKTILKPISLVAGVTVGSIIAAPFFMVRKTIIGAYNAIIKPFTDLAKGNPFDGKHMLKGVANVLTCGIFSAGKKVFKRITAYTNRFGFAKQLNAKFDSFSESQKTFREAIRLAVAGEFPGVQDPRGILRPMLHVFGFRHNVENMLKILHDAYLLYKKDIDKAMKLEGATDSLAEDAIKNNYTMHGFFNSTQFKTAKFNLRRQYNTAEDKNVLKSIKSYLVPV